MNGVLVGWWGWLMFGPREAVAIAPLFARYASAPSATLFAGYPKQVEYALAVLLLIYSVLPAAVAVGLGRGAVQHLGGTHAGQRSLERIELLLLVTLWIGCLSFLPLVHLR